MDTVSAKVSFDNQLRKIPLTAGSTPISWDELNSRVRSLFKLSSVPIQLSYVDDDGDTIIVDSDSELADAVDFAKRVKQTSLRFTLSQGVPVAASAATPLAVPGVEDDDSDSDPDFVLVTPPGSPRSTNLQASATSASTVARSENTASSFLSRSTYPAFQTEEYAAVRDTSLDNSALEASFTAEVEDAAAESKEVEQVAEPTEPSLLEVSENPETEVKEDSLKVQDIDASAEMSADSVAVANYVPIVDEPEESRSSEMASVPIALEVSLVEVEPSGAASPSAEVTETAHDQALPIAEEPTSNPEQPVHNDLDSFLAVTQPLVDDVLRRLEAHPHFIPALLSRFESQLSGSNWGISVLSPNGRHVHSTCPAPSVSSSTSSNHRLLRLLGRGNTPTAHPTTNWSGVICDVCEKVSFSGTRYKCTECYDYDMCSECYETKRPFHQHSSFDAVRSQNEVWRHVTCDGCGVRHFIGKRYVCSDCPDFDLCARCFASGRVEHEASHAFVAMERVVRNTELNTGSSSSGYQEMCQSVFMPVTRTPWVDAPFPATAPASVNETPATGSPWEDVPPPLPPYPVDNMSEVRMPGNFPTEESPAPFVPECRRRSNRLSRTYANVFEDALVNHNLRECRDQLVAMGYDAHVDDEVLIPLLERNNGNVAEVVRYLLDEGLIL